MSLNEPLVGVCQFTNAAYRQEYKTTASRKHLYIKQHELVYFEQLTVSRLYDFPNVSIWIIIKDDLNEKNCNVLEMIHGI